MAEPIAGLAGSAPANANPVPAAQPAANEGSAPSNQQQVQQSTQTQHSAGDSGSAPSGGDAGQQRTGSPSVVDEVISLRRRAQQAEAAAAYYQGLADGGKGQGAPQQQQRTAQDGPPTPPKLEEFQDWDAFNTAKDSYLIERAKYDIRQEYRHNQTVTQEQAVEKSWNDRLMSENDPQLVMMVNNPAAAVITTPMSRAIKTSDVGPKIARYLLTNPQEASRIAAMPSPEAQVFEVGRIGARFSASPAQQQVNMISQAPEPANRISQQGSLSPKSYSEMSTDEFMKRRNEESRRK